MVGPTANNSTRSSTLYLSQSSLQLLKASVSTFTKQLYLRSYTLLHKFCAKQNVPFSLPFTEVLICNFIGDLFQQGYSPSTITSHVSAISYLHKLFTFPTQRTLLLSEKLSKVLTTWQNLGTLDFQSLNLFLSNYYLPFIIQFKRQIQECFCPQFSSLPFMPLCGWVN